jgi:peptidoglycan-associated lipoprotein
METLEQEGSISMRNILAVSAAGAFIMSLGACATRQEPVQEATPVEPPVQEEEVVVERQPEVVEERTVVPAATGPRPGSVEDFTVNVGDRVYFDTDQYNLDAEDRARLDRQAAWLQSYPQVRLLIAGNADERGTREYNLALGERRANAARDYLVSMGIDPSRLETVSYGKERPTDPRSTPEAWALNRNAHSQIVSGAGS